LQHVSTQYGNLRANNIKLIKGTADSFIKSYWWLISQYYIQTNTRWLFFLHS